MRRSRFNTWPGSVFEPTPPPIPTPLELIEEFRAKLMADTGFKPNRIWIRDATTGEMRDILPSDLVVKPDGCGMTVHLWPGKGFAISCPICGAIDPADCPFRQRAADEPARS